jgi:hypothetical protein
LKNDFKAGLENGDGQNDLPYLWKDICERIVFESSRYSERMVELTITMGKYYLLLSAKTECLLLYALTA